MSLLRRQQQFQTTLIQKGWVSQKQLELILQEKGEKRLDQYLVKQGILSTQEVQEAWNEVQKKRLTTRYKSFGKYEVLETIARGAMGIIYKVRHQDLDQIYALKAIVSLGEDPKETLARFYREAKMSAKLRHPYIVQITDFGKIGAQPYLVMEYVEGKTLEEWIEQKQKLPLKEALSFMRKILQGLHYAHTEGVLHRDLKPSNIFITSEGLPKIGDFGLAKDLQTQTQAQLTYDGEILGTPAYMAPEQAAGDMENLDVRADIYSAGVCFYKMLTGRCPFEEDSISYLFYRIITEEAKPPSLWNPAVPKEIDVIILKALEKSKEKRYVSAEAFEQDLIRFQRGEPIVAKPATLLERVQKWLKRNIKTILPIAGIVFVTLSSLSYIIWERNQEKKQRLKTLVQNVQKILEQTQNKTFQNSHQKIKQLFDAINLLNIALSLEPVDPTLERLKINVGQEIMQQACALQEYDMASFVVTELRTVRLLSDAQIEQLEESILEEKTKTLQFHLQRLDHWIQTLQSSTIGKGEREDAIFEIAKMPEPEILARLHQYVQDGVLYFLQNNMRDSRKEEFYQTITLIVGRIAQPSSCPILFKALETLSQKIRTVPSSRRSIAEVQYMANLVQSLAHLRAKNVSSFLHRLRLDMGQGSLFWQTTEDAYQELAQVDEVSTKPVDSVPLLFQRGIAFLQEGNFEAALQDFTTVIQLDPLCIEAYRNRGIIYLKQKKYAEAEQEFSQEIGIQPTWEGYLNRGSVKTSLKDFSSALEDFQKALEKNPRAADIYYNRAFVYWNLGKFSLALQDFQKTLELDPNYTKAYMNRGILKSELHDLKGAIHDLEEAIRLNPQYIAAYVNLANFKITQSQWDEAIRYLNQAIQLDPRLEEAYINRGNAKHSRGDLEGALQDYHTALQLNPESYQTYNNRANLRMDRKEYAEALKDLNEALRINSRYTDAYLNRGSLRSRLGDVKGALEDYSQILQINPKYLNAYFNRGVLWREQGEYELAIEDFSQAIQLAPEDASLYTLRGSLLHALKRYKEAIEDYDQALKRKPSDSLTYTNRGAAKMALNNFEGALLDYKTVLQWEPNSAQTHLNLGILYVKMEQKDLAKIMLTQFLKLVQGNMDVQTEKSRQEVFRYFPELNPSSSVQTAISAKEKAIASAQKGDHYFQAQNFSQALRFYQQALEYDPENPTYLYQKSLVLQELKQFDEAITTLKLALSVPNNEEKIRIALLDLLLVRCKQQIQQQDYVGAQFFLKEYLLVAPSTHPDRNRVESLLEQVQKKIQEPK